MFRLLDSIGAWPSGKARDFGSRIRWFESTRPNHASKGTCLITTGALPAATASGQLKLFSGSAHRALTEEIAEFLNVQVGHARLQRFPDTECSFQIDENIRGTDVFV